MKVLFFDLKESEKTFFANNTFKDFEFTFFEENLGADTKLTEEQLKETDAICVSYSSFLTNEILSKFRNLRVITTRTSEFGHIDINYCTRNRIAVMNLEQYGEDAVAQYILGLIITLTRKIKPAVCDLMKKKLIPAETHEGRLLNNMTLGIIGCGNVGTKLAELVKHFDMKVLVSTYKNVLPQKELCEAVTFENLISLSDIIVLHMPYSEDISEIINEEVLKKMKDGVFIINTSGSELINLNALYKNIVSKKVEGAGLDIFFKDFIKNKNIIKKFQKLKNVIITHGLAYNSQEYTDFVLNTTINNIRNYYKGMNYNRIC